MLVYDTVGNAYKIDYQAIIGGAEPGHAVAPRQHRRCCASRSSRARWTPWRNLASPEYGEATFGEQIQQAVMVFAPNDFFGVLPNGTAWVARGHENRVDWRERGRPLDAAAASHTIPGCPSPRPTGIGCWRRCASSGKQYGMPQELHDPVSVRRYQAPVRFRAGAAERRSLAAAAARQGGRAFTYDVFNRKGAWQREVDVPEGRVAGGVRRKGAVYASIKEANGERTVGRFVVR